MLFFELPFDPYVSVKNMRFHLLLTARINEDYLLKERYYISHMQIFCDISQKCWLDLSQKLLLIVTVKIYFELF